MMLHEFPPIDPIIRKCLNKLDRKTEIYRKNIEILEKKRIKREYESIDETGKRRCNSCLNYFDVKDTIRIKYKENSSRMYRLCKHCIERMKELKYNK